MKRLILVLIVLLLQPSQAETTLNIPADTLQSVVVINTHWDATQAKMYRMERKSADSPWTRVGEPVLVNLGRTGLAWGESPLMDGFTPPKSHLQKREGDGRSPAGVFPIKRAFGHPEAPAGYQDSNLPFLHISDEQCVDDRTSEYYNQIVRPKEVGGVSWTSAERMKISVYELGLVVGHNCPKSKAGHGSCIFFHLEEGVGIPTSGCTAMNAPNLTDLVLWLKRDANPVVVQLPRSEFRKRNKELGLDY